MKWFLERMSEAGTWAGLAALFTFLQLWIILPDSLRYPPLLIAAIGSAIAAFALKETGR